MSFVNENQFYTSSSYPLFIMPQHDSDQSWSPFSTPSISPYGSPPQTTFQYSTSFNANSEYNPNQNYQVLPKPIGRPLTNSSNFVQNNIQQNNYQSQQKRLPKRSEQVDMTEYIRKSQYSSGRSKLCTFCRSNGESEAIYMSHSLKNSVNKITCPILMKYTCVECGATGEQTHTIKYCPVMQKKIRQQMLNKIVTSKDQF